MKEEEIREKVREAFEKTFPGIEGFSFDKSAEDIEQWDSLSHMTLVSELEKIFSVSLDVDEISEMDSVENVVKVMARKVGE
jgi:acyl carrier protein